MGLGRVSVPSLRWVPPGKLPRKTTSWIERVPGEPEPTLHSPNPIVLLVPSVTPAMLVTVPLVPMYGNGPLGGPPVCCAANSSDEPTEAK